MSDVQLLMDGFQEDDCIRTHSSFGSAEIRGAGPIVSAVDWDCLNAFGFCRDGGLRIGLLKFALLNGFRLLPLARRLELDNSEIEDSSNSGNEFDQK